MPVVAIINRKGGSGKSTLATHLAAYCSRQGVPVMLGDVDRQLSTQAWLQRRSTNGNAAGATIHGWAQDPSKVLRPPAGIQHVVLDTPGGLRGFDLARVVSFADAILIPVCHSLFDRESAAACHAELLTLPRVSSGRCRVAAVGMRLDSRTRADEDLRRWAATQDLEIISVLREAQAYVRCLEHGLTLFDQPEAQAKRDLAQWQPIIRWLGPLLEVAPADSLAARPVTAPAGNPLVPRAAAATKAAALAPAARVASAPRVAPPQAAPHFEPLASMFVQLDSAAQPRGWNRLLRWLPVLGLGRR